MGEIERIIIDAKGLWVLQVQAAHAAVQAKIKEGEIIGVSQAGYYFGVKRNKTSIRVYPQEPR